MCCRSEHWQADSLPLSHQGSNTLIQYKEELWVRAETYCKSNLLFWKVIYFPSLEYFQPCKLPTSLRVSNQTGWENMPHGTSKAERQLPKCFPGFPGKLLSLHCPALTPQTSPHGREEQPSFREVIWPRSQSWEGAGWTGPGLQNLLSLSWPAGNTYLVAPTH